MISVTRLNSSLVKFLVHFQGAKVHGRVCGFRPLAADGPPRLADVNRNDIIPTPVMRSVAVLSIKYTDSH